MLFAVDVQTQSTAAPAMGLLVCATAAWPSSSQWTRSVFAQQGLVERRRVSWGACSRKWTARWEVSRQVRPMPITEIEPCGVQQAVRRATTW